MGEVADELPELMNRFRGPLIGLIASWGTAWGDAAEIAQDSFAEAWLHRENCRGDWRDANAFGAWLRGVAKNQFRNWSRSRRRRLRVVAPASEVVERAAERAGFESSEHFDLLFDAIERLPAKQRQVIWMHYLEETSVNDVAALLAVSAKTVEGRLYQGRLALKRMLSGTSAARSRTVRMLLCL